MCVCDLSIGDVDAGGSDVQGHLHLPRKMGYMRSCGKIKREVGREMGEEGGKRKEKEKGFIFLRNLRQAGDSP